MRNNSKRQKGPVFAESGILLVDKPATWTSFDVVNFVRSRFNIPKVGHCGTLDPAATGLLVLVLGSFTKYSTQLSGDDKVYQATLRLGLETDSFDLDGQETARHEVDVTPDQVREAVLSFVGEQLQKPPMVSAVKVGGKKLYELARKGVEIEREARPIVIHSIDIDRLALPDCDFTLCCSKGTYVRSLCADIGAKLGTGGVLAGLRRVRCGKFHLADAVTIDQLKTMEAPELTAHLAAELAKYAGAAI